MCFDFRGIRDEFMQTHDSDYFENHRQATFVQQEYAIRNPKDFVGYGEHWWGFTACDAPDWCKRVVDGVEREFFDYIARGAHLVRTTAPSPRGSSSPRSRVLLKSSSRPCGTPNRLGDDREIWVQAVVQSIVCRAG